MSTSTSTPEPVWMTTSGITTPPWPARIPAGPSPRRAHHQAGPALTIAYTILAALVAAAAVWALPAGTPDPHPPTRWPTAPHVAPTHPVAPPPPLIRKPALIIQQNPGCWLAVPGATCDPGTRTYL